MKVKQHIIATALDFALENNLFNNQDAFLVERYLDKMIQEEGYMKMVFGRWVEVDGPGPGVKKGSEVGNSNTGNLAIGRSNTGKKLTVDHGISKDFRKTLSDEDNDKLDDAIKILKNPWSTGDDGDVRKGDDTHPEFKKKVRQANDLVNKMRKQSMKYDS